MAIRLDLETVCNALPIWGVNGANTSLTQWANLSLSFSYSQYKKTIGCHIFSVITVPLPVQSINTSSTVFPENVHNNLADPGFNVSPEIILLLVAEIFNELICAPPTVMLGGLSWLYETAFSWIISGPMVANQQQSGSVLPVMSFIMTSTRMDVEKLRYGKHEDKASCEQHFQEIYQRQANGRFIVRLPFSLDLSCLERSMEASLSHFLSLERKL